MTATGDFLPADQDQEFEQVGPSYPTAFGVEFTPKIQAILLGLLGLGGAFAIYNFLAKSTFEFRIQSYIKQLEEYGEFILSYSH